MAVVVALICLRVRARDDTTIENAISRQMYAWRLRRVVGQSEERRRPPRSTVRHGALPRAYLIM